MQQENKSRLQEKKIVPQNKYRQLRNKVTSQIRKANVGYNNNRIKEANTENDLWKIAKLKDSFGDFFMVNEN